MRLGEWLRAIVEGVIPPAWRVLDCCGESNNVTAPVDQEAEAEATRTLCAAEFVRDVGDLWEAQGNLTASTQPEYLRLFHKACPGFPRGVREE